MSESNDSCECCARPLTDESGRVCPGCIRKLVLIDEAKPRNMNVFNRFCQFSLLLDKTIDSCPLCEGILDLDKSVCMTCDSALKFGKTAIIVVSNKLNLDDVIPPVSHECFEDRNSIIQASTENLQKCLPAKIRHRKKPEGPFAFLTRIDGPTPMGDRKKLDRTTMKMTFTFSRDGQTENVFTSPNSLCNAMDSSGNAFNDLFIFSQKLNECFSLGEVFTSEIRKFGRVLTDIVPFSASNMRW